MKTNQYFSRSIKSTRVVCMVVDTETAEVLNKTFIISQLPKSEEKLLSNIRKEYETDSEKIVSVVSKHPIEKLMGITYEQFFENAVELNPKTHKPYKPEELPTNWYR